MTGIDSSLPETFGFGYKYTAPGVDSPMSFDILLNVDPEKEEKIKSSFGIEIVTKGSPELTVFLDVRNLRDEEN